MSFVGNAIADAFVKVRPDTRGFKTETAVGVRSALSGLGAGRTAAAVGLGAIGGTALVVAAALGTSALEAAKLEQALNVLQATAELTDAQMEQAGAQARELGADLTLPGVSATDAAEALLSLSKAGLSFEDAMAGTKGVLTLAAAANISFADSAEFVGNALNSFELPGEQAAHVVDLVANASKLAQGEITDFNLGLQQSGAVAHLAGVSVDELTALLTLLAKAGISGSDAGTSVRTTLLRLIPTSKEAADVVKALGISVADQEGNIRPLANIFEQYRQALAQLTPATRQQALAQIFGTDAIRAAAIFSKAGAAGIEDMTEAVSKEGTAAEIAAAKNKGLLGAGRNLGSQLQTLAATIGSFIVPALTDMTNSLADAVGGVNDLVSAVRGIDFGGIDLPDIPGGDKVGGAGGFFSGAKEVAESFIPGRDELRGLKRLTKLITDLFADNKDPLSVNFSATDQLLKGLTGDKARIKSNTQELARLARLENEKVGAEAQKGQAEGIIRNAQRSVAAAKQALADTIRAGNEAIHEAAVAAKQSLITIGNDLAQRTSDLIDRGPLGRKIAALQAQLAGNDREGGQQRVRSDLANAQAELARAQRSAATAGKPTAEQKRRMADFLRPFEDRVADAKRALEDFNTEGVVARLQKAADAQKKAVTQGIADVVAAFNTGRISADEANKRIARVIGSAVGDYKKAGTGLGLAFNQGFEDTLKGLREQITEIVAGPVIGDSGFGPGVVSNTDAAAKAAGATAAARVSLAEAQINLAETSKDQLAQIKISNELLAKIAKEKARPKPKPKPSGINFIGESERAKRDDPSDRPGRGGP